jgi:hypothetical protein
VLNLALMLGQVAAFDVVYFVKLALVVAGVCVVGYLILKAMGVTVPPIVLQIAGVVGLVVLGLVAINLIARMM